MIARILSAIAFLGMLALTMAADVSQIKDQIEMKANQAM